jgi:hypothetical protein
LAALFALSATTAAAQTPFTAHLTGHLGAVSQGDIRDWTVTPGASIAVVDQNGIGAEFDLAHGGDFDTTLFADSSITTAMLNFVALYPQGRIRPFVIAGAGLMRVRVAYSAEESSTGSTDIAWSAGGGVLYMLNDAFGIRGDVRYFRHFSRQDDIPLGDNGILDFVRTSFGLTYTWPLR